MAEVLPSKIDVIQNEKVLMDLYCDTLNFNDINEENIGIISRKLINVLELHDDDYEKKEVLLNKIFNILVTRNKNDYSDYDYLFDVFDLFDFRY